MSNTNHIISFTHLHTRPHADRALHMLQRIASLVKPIMRTRNWILPVLAEFFPDQPNLLGLNVNKGQEILLRLRPAHAPDSFYDEANVIQTMLHELVHNIHGPHDDTFYKYLAGLQDEYAALQRSGYAGEGFFSAGKRLGTGVSHDLPPHRARVKALEAAEKRKLTAKVFAGGGNKLGGSGALRSRADVLSTKEMAALAADRRARDKVACGSDQQTVATREAEKAAREGIENSVIDLTIDDGNDAPEDVDGVVRLSEERVQTPRQSKLTKSRHFSGSEFTAASSLKQRDVGKAGAKLQKDSHITSHRSKPVMSIVNDVCGDWACTTCTLLNAHLVLQCNACGMRRPPDERFGWDCLVCGEFDMPHEFWTCRTCGVMKTRS